MNRFIAVATEFNVLNLVALRALAQPGDQLLILDDPYSVAQGWGQRLESVVANFMDVARVKRLAIPDWRLDALLDISECVLDDAWAGGAPKALHQLLIGGRKHPALLLHELMLSKANDDCPLFVHSVERRPFRLESSGIRDDGELFLDETPLSGLGAERVMTLDEVLTLHGYRRTKGDKLGVGQRIAQSDPKDLGQRFELQAARLVAQQLTVYQSWISELWMGVEIAPASGGVITMEFDILVLARDGSTVHFECKAGGTGGMKELTKKVFHQRRAFTPESKFVLCKPHIGTSALQVRDALRKQYTNLGDFSVVILNPSVKADSAIDGVGSANQQVKQALETAWSSLIDTAGS